MIPAVVLHPGRMSLSDLRSIYRGAPVSLDPIARADVEAGAAALKALGSNGANDVGSQFGGIAEPPCDSAAETGEPLQVGILRLILAIKLNSLGQGFSGVRWAVLERIVEFLSLVNIPSLPGAHRDDRAIMERSADLLGEHASSVEPALASSERAALLSGTQVRAAFALAGLFEAERVFQSALVSSALAMAALGGQTSRDHRVHRLHGYPGEMDVAAAIRSLIPALAQGGPDWGPDIARMGACVDLLRQAGATLELAANAVSEDQLVFWFSQQMATGFEDTASIALASDMVAAALREIGSLTQPRAALAAAQGCQNGNPFGTTAQAWDQMVATFVSENEKRACPVHAGNGQSDAFTAGPRRLLPMAGTTTLLVAIELLASSRILDATAVSGSPLDAVLALVRGPQPDAGADQMPAGDLPRAAELVRSGAVAEAAGIPLPSLAPGLQTRTPAPSGAGVRQKQSERYRISNTV